MLSLLAALVVLPVGAATAEPVVLGAEGTVTTHAAGMPAASEPWRTLLEASLTTDTRTGVWSMGARLGGPVPAGRTVSITWVPGRQQPAGCEALVGVTEPAATVAADGTVSVERPVDPGYYPESTSQETNCLSVHLWTENAASDTLVGTMVPITRLAGAEARPATRLRIATGRTTPVLLAVTSHVRDTSSVAVSGSGPGVRLKDLTLGPLVADQTRPVVARLSAPGIADTEVALAARDDVGSDSFDQSWAVVAREIRAQRPDPGKYLSTDGSVRFRVTPEHRVVRLRTSGVLCEGSSTTRATYPVELRLPKAGATAKVTQLGSRWFGAELSTSKRRVVRGSFFYGTSQCSSWQVFVARRQD